MSTRPTEPTAVDQQALVARVSPYSAGGRGHADVHAMVVWKKRHHKLITDLACRLCPGRGWPIPTGCLMAGVSVDLHSIKKAACEETGKPCGREPTLHSLCRGAGPLV